MASPEAFRRFNAPIGPLAVAAAAAGVRCVLLPKEAASGGMPGRAAARQRAGGLPAGRAAAGPAARKMAARAEREILEYLAGRRRTFTVPVDLAGVPPFHRKVLAALGRVPYGRTVTYGQLAARAGRPRAARAVGSCVARNPVPLIIPCHRVVASGGLGGFGGGLDLKRRLLALEAGAGACTSK
jgi:methylated-DNA-[protein]-cysteine S-methyltransferase